MQIKRIFTRFFSKSKRIDEPNQGLQLNEIIDLKVKMADEKTCNHLFDDSKPYQDKIMLGTTELNEFKIKNKITICENYRMG